MNPDYCYRVPSEDREFIPIIMIHKVDFVLNLRFDLKLYQEIRSMINSETKAENFSKTLINYRTVIKNIPASMFTPEEQSYLPNFPFCPVIVHQQENEEISEEVAKAANEMIEQIIEALPSEDNDIIVENHEIDSEITNQVENNNNDSETNELNENDNDSITEDQRSNTCEANAEEILTTELANYNFNSHVSDVVVCQETSSCQTTN